MPGRYRDLQLRHLLHPLVKIPALTPPSKVWRLAWYHLALIQQYFPQQLLVPTSTPPSSLGNSMELPAHKLQLVRGG